MRTTFGPWAKYTADDKYNAAHWDGEKWELKKIPSIICGNNSPIQSAIFTVYAFSSNNVWFSDGAELIHYDGANFKQDCSINPLLMGKINKLWGTSDKDLYIVGTNGLIAHYDGQQWQRIESGTDLPIQDIWGFLSKRTGTNEILCIASDKYHNRGSKLLKIDGTQIIELNNKGLPWSISGIWFIPDTKYYIAGDGFYPSYNLNHVWQRDTTFHPIYKDAVRGQAINDIVVSGSNGLLSHYNGDNWKHYIYDVLPFIKGRYYSTDIKLNTIIAVGYNEHRAIIVHGKR